MTIRRKKKKYDDDDGRVIARMNVPGMPWYDERQPDGSALESSTQEKKESVAMTKEEKREYRKETRMIVFGVYKYLLPILGVFIVAFAILIILMAFVWLK